MISSHPDGKYEQIADYMDIPACLMMYSAPTEAEGIVAEIVTADDTFDETFILNHEKVKNKIIFTGRPPQDFVQIAHAGGALGIVSDYMPLFPGVRNSREECREAFRWENNLIYPVNDTGLFGFSLSPEKGDYLREKIRQAALKGKSVRLHADVKTRFYDGSIYTVSGKIAGSRPHMGEVMVISHLYEPGANDNASGCGLSLELAATLKRTIDEGRIPQPSRDIRFVMGFECLGLMGYSDAYPERILNTVAAINLDMVGASTKDMSKLHLWHNPLSSWSYTDTLLPSLIRAYENFTGEKMKFKETAFSIGDNLLADPSFGVPTMSMLMHPALSYHSSMDITELVDPLVLKRNAVISGAFVLFIANPCNEGVKWLIKELRAASDYRGFLTLDLLSENVANIVNIEQLENTAEATCRTSTANRELEERLEKIVPVRIKKGTLSFHTLSADIRGRALWKPYYDYHVNCPLFWTDGKRNLYEIGRLAADELGKDITKDYIAGLLEFYTFLKKYEYVSWN